MEVKSFIVDRDPLYVICTFIANSLPKKTGTKGFVDSLHYALSAVVGCANAAPPDL